MKNLLKVKKILNKIQKKNVLAFDKGMDCADPRHKPNIKKV